MTAKELENFFNYLKKSWEIFGPKEIKSEQSQTQILIERLENFQELALDQRLPFYSFKRFFIPEKEKIFDYKNEELKIKLAPKKVAVFGLNILDLKAILLYDQVFEKDAYYQARRQSILVIGHSLVPNLPQNIFEQTYEEDILEHLSFDIFLAATGGQSISNNKTQVFTGSLLGQKILKDFGYQNFTHIQFSGPVKEGRLDERMISLKDKLENHHNQKIWDELGSRCIECGKCTVVCPTCFCFRIDDQPSLEAGQGERERCWDSCFYQEFSEIAGGYKFLNETAKRIHFWYFHKFARIPEEFDFLGCVGCRRCAAVCPVGIDIAEVLKEIEK